MPVVHLEVSAPSVAVGQPEALLWSTTNASSCIASGAWAGPQASAGQLTLSTATVGTYTYALTCTNDAGSQAASATYAVTAAVPGVAIAVTPPTVTLGTSATLAWSATHASACAASGSWSGKQASTGSTVLTPAATGASTYTLTCTGPGGQTTASTVLMVSATGAVQNQIGVVLDNGPANARGVLNVPYVSVTLCVPGTSQCATIDHVFLDTGSYGLRLLSSTALPGGFAYIPGSAPGTLLAECAQFVSGYTWGSVAQFDVKMAGELASAVPVQIIADSTANFSQAPLGCSSSGTNVGSVAALGANGIIGVGLGTQDCGSYCVTQSALSPYYECTAGNACTETTASLANQVANPVAGFAVDNDGVVLSLPAVPPAGASSLTGTLTFGVNTQGNNQLTSQAVYLANPSTYNFTTTYNSQTLTDSFIDSGSNVLYFNDPSIPACSSPNYFDCPATTLYLTATNASYTGSVSAAVAFTVANLDALQSDIVVAPIAGPNSLSLSFDWGLPFFFGRPIYVVIDGHTTASGRGPFWAY